MICPYPALPGGPPSQAEDGDGDGDSLAPPDDPRAENDPHQVDRLGKDEKETNWGNMRRIPTGER